MTAVHQELLQSLLLLWQTGIFSPRPLQVLRTAAAGTASSGQEVHRAAQHCIKDVILDTP